MRKLPMKNIGKFLYKENSRGGLKNIGSTWENGARDCSVKKTPQMKI